MLLKHNYLLIISTNLLNHSKNIFDESRGQSLIRGILQTCNDKIDNLAGL